jgi:hypothetical protein
LTISWKAGNGSALILGNSKDQGSRSLSAWIFNSNDQSVNSTLEVFQRESENCTPIGALESITAIQSCSKAIISCNNQVSLTCAVGFESSLEGRFFSNGPWSTSFSVNPFCTVADKVRMVFLVIFFKDDERTFRVDDIGVLGRRSQENRLL